MNSIWPKGWTLQWDYESKHKSNTLFSSIKNKIDKMVSLHPKFQFYWKLKEILNITKDRVHFKNILFKNKIEDKWNQIDHDYWRRLIDSVKGRTNI